MSNDVYVCSKLVNNVCVEYAKFNQSSWLPNLTVNEAKAIFVAVALLFAVAFVFREFGYFIKRQ